MKNTTIKHFISKRGTTSDQLEYATSATTITVLNVWANNVRVDPNGANSYTVQSGAGTITFAGAQSPTDRVVIDYTDSTCLKAGYDINLNGTNNTLDQSSNVSIPPIPTVLTPQAVDFLGLKNQPITVNGVIDEQRTLISYGNTTTGWTGTNVTLTTDSQTINSSTETTLKFTVTSGSGDSLIYDTWTEQNWTAKTYLTFWYKTTDVSISHFVNLRNNTSWLSAIDFNSQLRDDTWTRVFVELSDYSTTLSQVDGIRFHVDDTETTGGEIIYIKDIEIVGPSEYYINLVYLKTLSQIQNSMYELYDEELALGEDLGMLRVAMTNFTVKKINDDDPMNIVITYSATFVRSGA